MSGSALTMAAYSSAIPGTGWRALSFTSSALRRAISGRGSIVTITVSSTSLTSPTPGPGATMRTGASTGFASSVEILTVFQPGSRWDSSRTST